MEVAEEIVFSWQTFFLYGTADFLMLILFGKNFAVFILGGEGHLFAGCGQSAAGVYGKLVPQGIIDIARFLHFVFPLLICGDDLPRICRR